MVIYNTEPPIPPTNVNGRINWTRTKLENIANYIDAIEESYKMGKYGTVIIENLEVNNPLNDDFGFTVNPFKECVYLFSTKGTLFDQMGQKKLNYGDFNKLLSSVLYKIVIDNLNGLTVRYDLAEDMYTWDINMPTLDGFTKKRFKTSGHLTRVRMLNIAFGITSIHMRQKQFMSVPTLDTISQLFQSEKIGGRHSGRDAKEEQLLLYILYTYGKSLAYSYDLGLDTAFLDLKRHDLPPEYVRIISRGISAVRKCSFVMVYEDSSFHTINVLDLEKLGGNNITVVDWFDGVI